MLYNRIVALWMIFAVIILISTLLSQPDGGYPIVVFTFLWIILLLVGIFCLFMIRKHVSLIKS